MNVFKSLADLGTSMMTAIQGDITATLNTAGSQWRVMSTNLAPIKTGRLRDLETFKVEGNKLTLILGAPYDIFQEFGTRHIRPRPHVRPALNAIGRLWGATIEMSFLSPHISSPVLAHQAGFIHPKGITAKQRAHIKANLLPASKKHYKGNVRRAKMVVRKIP